MSEVAVNNASATAGATSLSAARRNYILFVLTLVATVNYLDRQVLTILLEPIRKELVLTDTQIGSLTGIAFTAIYVILSIPAARLADRWSRRNVIAAAIAVWSVMTVFCGMAQTFVQLFLARMGVGMGEAGGMAPSQAAVGNMFSREQRSTAMSVFFLSAALGTALGLLWGGFAAQSFGWRTAFILAGVPGLILAPLVYFTVPEVRQGFSDGVRKPLRQLPFVKTVFQLLALGSFRNMIIAYAVNAFITVGVQAWVPSFLARSHGMSSSQIGLGLAIVFSVSYAIGALLGGRLVDVLGRRDLRWHFWVGCFAIVLTGAFAAYAFVAPTDYVFLVLGLQMVFGSMWAGPLNAITQALSPVAFRATAAAFVAFVINVLSLGLGLQMIGVVSDLLRPAFGEESLRITLLSATGLVLPAAFFFYRASLTYRADLAVADARNVVA